MRKKSSTYDRSDGVDCVKDRNFLDTVMEFEQQLESMQLQFRDLKEFVAIMMEEHQTLQHRKPSFTTASRRNALNKEAVS